MREALWIFGYGSLVWRPSFPFAERRGAWIDGFARRFWQGSTDHRGVPGAPGRVVTLEPDARARCFGVAYRVDDEGVPARRVALPPSIPTKCEVAGLGLRGKR
jgi:cation transport regulator ChaC